MSEFTSSLDIANRACQHLGVARISTALGFTEDSPQAGAINFAYGKLRRAELQRNYWTFATKKAALRPVDTATMLLSPSLWDSTATYFVGSIVSDLQGTLWTSVVPDNLNNQTQNSPAWAPYFGPMTADPYDSTTTYQAGEIVYTAPGDGTNKVFLSLQNDNADNPATATAWDATSTFFKNQVVTYSAVAYMSLIDLNVNQVPSAAPQLWAVGTTYSSGTLIGASNGIIYSSLINGNVGNDPTTDLGVHWTSTGVLNPWTRVFTGGSGSVKWLEIGGSDFPSGVALATLNITYPIGAGPSSQAGTRNVYRLPANFLRKAPQDPKAGSYSNLGAPTNRAYDDWTSESGYIVSAFSDTILLRFIADVQDVRLMHDMFCEGLAARIAFEVCEAVTQSTSRRQLIAQTYQKMMTEARTVDAIEEGSTELPLDEWLACRA